MINITITENDKNQTYEWYQVKEVYVQKWPDDDNA